MMSLFWYAAWIMTVWQGKLVMDISLFLFHAFTFMAIALREEEYVNHICPLSKFVICFIS